MTFELFGTARLRAGTPSFEVAASTIGEALEILARDVPALEGSILDGGRVHPAFRLSLNGERFVSDPRTPLVEEDRVLLLSADVGG